MVMVCQVMISSVGISETSNVTAVTEVRSASAHLFASMWCPLVSVITTLYIIIYNTAIIFHL